jgi:hypothetical protein
MSLRPYFRRTIALTNEHGSWVFLFSPLLIGLFAGNSFSVKSVFLVTAALAVFLIRQPVSIAVKAYSGRRPRQDLPAAGFWVLIYGAVGIAATAGLILHGFSFVLYLSIPGLPVFLWHLYLISKRAERKQIGIEIVASGVLALSSIAAYWVGKGYPAPAGWWLWGLSWFQSAASIVYAYLRLEQRTWKGKVTFEKKFLAGRRALLYTSFNLVVVAVLSTLMLLPPLLAIPYGLQWLETLWGSFVRPAVGYKPTQIGFRQLAISSMFTILFIITWNI